MGNKQSTTIQSYMECVNAIAADVLIKNQADSVVDISGTQNLTVGIYNGCKLKGNKFEQIANLRANINIEIDDKTESELQTKFVNELMNKLDSMEDKVATAIGTFLNPGGSSRTKAENKTIIKNTIEAGYTKDTFVSLGAKINANQTMNIPCYGTAEATNFLQQLNADIFQTMQNKSESYKKLVTDLDNRATNDTVVRQNAEVLNNLINGVFGWRAALAGSLAGLAGTLLGDGGGAAGMTGSPPGSKSDDDSMPLILSVVSSSCSLSCILALVVFFIMSRRDA
jgi:hypothetical protein